MEQICCFLVFRNAAMSRIDVLDAIRPQAGVIYVHLVRCEGALPAAVSPALHKQFK